MLENITCDTDINEIIKEEDISTYLNSLEETTNNYEGKIRTCLINEAQDGGLSTSAYSIDDSSPILEKSQDILNEIVVCDNVSYLKEEALAALQTQRTKEIMILTEKVQEKIEELNKKIRNIELIISSSDIFPNTDTYEIYANQKSELTIELSNYKNKLKTLEGMK